MRVLALPNFVVDHAFVEFAAPLVLHEEVSLQNGLNHEVVLLVAGFEQVFLHDRKLCFVDANKATLSLGDCHLLADLQIAVEQDLFSKGPADIDAPNQVLRLLRVLRQLVSFRLSIIPL